MAELKLSPPAYDYLSKIPVAMWSRSKFSTNPKSDLIVNNLSECFNSYILDATDKPILIMLDTIRRKLMRRFQVNRASIAKMSEKLCPKIQVKVDKAGVKAGECLLLYSGEGKYVVVRTETFLAFHVTMPSLPFSIREKGKKKGVVSVGAGTSGQVAACGKVASASGGSGSVAGKGNGATDDATGRGNGATGTGGAAGGNGTSSSGGGASRKAKVVMVPTVEKAMERIVDKKQKKI
ncbi:DEK carboxy-terminal domain protein [Fagus crenata]